MFSMVTDHSFWSLLRLKVSEMKIQPASADARVASRQCCKCHCKSHTDAHGRGRGSVHRVDQGAIPDSSSPQQSSEL